MPTPSSPAPSSPAPWPPAPWPLGPGPSDPRTLGPGPSAPWTLGPSDPGPLHLPPPFHRARHRELVRVAEVAADGHAHADAGDAGDERLQQLREVERRGFALDRRV